MKRTNQLLAVLLVAFALFSNSCGPKHGGPSSYGTYGGGGGGTPPTYSPYGTYDPNLPCSSLVGPNQQYKTNDELRKHIVDVLGATFTKDMVWYRWGDKRFEQSRIGMVPSFDMKTVNAGGGTAAGRGLYVANTPGASAEYADYVSDPSQVYMITIVASAGTPYIDLTDPNTRDLLFNMGLTEQIINDCNPPLMVKYTTSEWWVLKTPDNTRIESFDGKYLSTQDIFNLANPNSGALNRSARARQFFVNNVQKTLAKRVYNLPGNEQIPRPLTSLFPVSQWPSIPELAPQVGSAPSGSLQYFWRYDKSCGSYYNNGNVLVEDNVNTGYCGAYYPGPTLN
jgi:hypothetical protein